MFSPSWLDINRLGAELLVCSAGLLHGANVLETMREDGVSHFVRAGRAMG